MQGLMQDTPLALPHLFNRAETLFKDKEIVTALPTGRERITYGDWAARTRKLGGVLDALGISYNEVVALLESEGLDKFVASWKELLADVEGALAAARKDA